MILAIVCQNPEQAFDIEFFKNYGYSAVPKSNQIYITDVIELFHSNKKEPSFLLVYDIPEFGKV